MKKDCRTCASGARIDRFRSGGKMGWNCQVSVESSRIPSAWVQRLPYLGDTYCGVKELLVINGYGMAKMIRPCFHWTPHPKLGPKARVALGEGEREDTPEVGHRVWPPVAKLSKAQREALRLAAADPEGRINFTQITQWKTLRILEGHGYLVDRGWISVHYPPAANRAREYEITPAGREALEEHDAKAKA